MFQKLGHEHRMFSRNFYDALERLPPFAKNQRSFVYNSEATTLRHKNSKWRRAGNFKAKIDDIRIHFVLYTKTLFPL